MGRVLGFPRVVLASTVTLLVASACGRADSEEASSSLAGRPIGFGGAGPIYAQGGLDVVLQPGGGKSTGGKGAFEECAGEVTSGKIAPLDMFIMLDTSGSMLDPTGSGAEKWEAVKTALVSFLSDPSSDGLGVGIQYFPLRKKDVPDSCTTNEQCGSGGPCLLKTCWNAGNIVPCNTSADCRNNQIDLGECVSFGFCELDDEYICSRIGESCGPSENGTDLGMCELRPTFCLNATECAVAAYQAPAVPISQLPGARDALVDSIDAREPEGLTPTAPAIRGAIEHSRVWANEHPGHAVVAVLATDGLPTECLPIDIPTIAGLASAGLGGRPSIPTFVIGVFGPNDVDAQMNLNAIARAGGSQTAFMVDTSGDVTKQFTDALNQIRGSRLGCEFQIPAPTNGQALDYQQVNVQLSNAGTTTPLYFVGDSEADCDASGGWYYDSNPAVSAPSRIVMCPATCRTIEGARDASVQIQLGCQMRVR